MIAYNDFLEYFNVVSEEQFNDIVESLPEIDSCEFDDLDSVNNIARCIIDSALKDFDYVYCEWADFDEKTFELEDVDSLENLFEIKDMFKNWTISNFNELEEALKVQEEENKELEEFYKKKCIIESVLENIPTDEVIKFAKQYGYEK